MPEISILTPLLFFIGANASEPYEEAMTRQIEDDVLRKFYIDMNPGHILYEPQSVSWVYHHSKFLRCIIGKQGFNIEDYFDVDPETESQEKLETGVDLSRISTEQIKKVLQVLSCLPAMIDLISNVELKIIDTARLTWKYFKSFYQAASSQSEQHSFGKRPPQPNSATQPHQVGSVQVCLCGSEGKTVLWLGEKFNNVG